MTEAVKTERKRSKGPIRIEAIVPITILIGVIWAYATLFLDGHVRRAAEYAASWAHGAQVDIRTLHLSFTEPSLTIQGVEVTDKDTPTHNTVSLDKIKFALLWDALLRAKLVISEASVTGLTLNSLRKSPGVVFPPPPPKPDSAPSITSQLRAELEAEAEARTKNNILGDIANILGGADASKQLSEIREQLQAETKIKDLQASLTSKKSEWTKRIDELPKPEAAKAVLDKIRSTKVDVSNPATAKAQFDALKADIAKVDEMVKTYQGGQKQLETDIDVFNASLKDIDEAARKDLEALQNRFKIPSIDKDSITKSLLSKLLGDKLVKVTRLIDQAKAYMPDRSAIKKNEKPEFVPHPRGAGRTYRFPVTTGYPLVWLKRAELSSKSSPEGFTGDFLGQLTNISTDPELIKAPTTLKLEGDAPKQEFRDIKLTAVLDQAAADAKADLTVGLMPFPEYQFSSGQDVEFGILPSTATLQTSAKFDGDKLEAVINQTVKEPRFKTGAKSEIVASALKIAADRIKTLTMKISLSGNLTHQKIGFDSNLGSELASGLQMHLKQKIDQARAKLKSFVDGRIGSEKARLTGEYDKAKSGLTGVLKGKETEFKNLQAELQKALKDKGGLESEKTKKDIENKAKDLFKKIKI